MRSLEFCGEKLKTIYIDDELQDKLDIFTTAIRLMGYKIDGSSGTSADNIYEKIHVEFTNGKYKIAAELESYKGEIYSVVFKIYSELVFQMSYYYMGKQELEELYEMLDKILLYIE